MDFGKRMLKEGLTIVMSKSAPSQESLSCYGSVAWVSGTRGRAGGRAVQGCQHREEDVQHSAPGAEIIER